MDNNKQHNVDPSGRIDLSVDLGPIQLANPLLTASGTCGYAFELADYLDIARLGAFVTKSITLHPRLGNPPQRTCETAAGMLNAIGLANVGLEEFCRTKVPLLEKMPVPVFVNIAGSTVEDYLAVARRLADYEIIKGLEINISCPNVKKGGMSFGTNPPVIHNLVAEIRRACPDTLLIVKLTPNVTDIAATARAAIDGGADVLSLVNTFVGMAVDIETRQPVLANRTGGLSGPAIKPMALYLVDRVYRQVARDAGIPLIGMGGITSARDALEFIIAGASAVAVGTAMLIDPAGVLNILAGIKDYLQRHDIACLGDLTGTIAEYVPYD